MPTLIVQMGHCYRTTGATGTNGEQQFATAVANACIALLHGAGGWSVRKILADESSSSYRGDAFVAVHCDGSVSSAARGASVGYRTPEGQALGQAWKRAYAARGWPGFRQDNYTAALANYYGTGTAVDQANRRAVIIECGFLTNPDDRALLTGPGGVDRVALAIGDALGITNAQPGQPPTPGEDDDMDLRIPLYPTADSASKAFAALALPGPARDETSGRAGSKLKLTTGWGQKFTVRVWFLAPGDKRFLGVSGGNGHVYTVTSDNPGVAPIPDGTVAIHAEWTSADAVHPGDLRVVFVPL